MIQNRACSCLNGLSFGAWRSETRLARSLVACLAVPLIAGSAEAFTTTLGDLFESTTHVAALSWDQTGGTHSEVFEYPWMLPSSGAPTAIDGEAQGTSVYDLSNAVFEVAPEHSITGLFGSAGQTVAVFNFTVDEGVNYTAAGSFSVVSPDGRFIYLYGSLFDWDLNSFAFESWQRSVSTPNESLTLGQSGGDESNTSSGSLTGTLVAGHHYEFYISAYVSSRISPSTTPATASGVLSLHLSQAPEVPSSTPVGIALLYSLLGLVGIRSIAGRNGPVKRYRG